MDIAVSVDPMAAKPQDVEGMNVVLDLVNYIRLNWNRSLPLIATDLEDYKPISIIVPTPVKLRHFERLLELANYIDIYSIIMKPPRHLEVSSLLDAAAEYDVSISWIVGPGGDVNVGPFRRLKLTFNIPSFGSFRRLAEYTIPRLGLADYAIAYNVKGGEWGLPIMSGPIDYLKIVRLYNAFGWDGFLILRYRAEYYDRYRSDLYALKSFIEAAGGSILDRETIRLLNRLFKGVFEGFKKT